jgi:hypothetical protein
MVRNLLKRVAVAGSAAGSADSRGGDGDQAAVTGRQLRALPLPALEVDLVSPLVGWLVVQGPVPLGDQVRCRSS